MDIHFEPDGIASEPPFWGRWYSEQIERGARSANRVTFGAEPKDCEVWDFVLKHDCQFKFSPSVAVAIRPEAVNPKRNGERCARQTAPRPDRHKIAAGFAAPARMHPNRSRKCSRGSSRRPNNSAFRAAAAETKGKALGH